VIKSMTGFAALAHESELASVGVTVRAVNHRFLDVQVRAPSWLPALEPRLRARLQARVARGRVELAVTVQLRGAAAPAVELNEDVARALAAAIDRSRERGFVTGTLTPGDLLRLPQAIVVRDRPSIDDAVTEGRLTEAIEAAVDRALADLDAMRTREGEHLRRDLESRRALLTGLIEALRAAAEAGREAVEERLRTRVAEIARELPADETLIAQEIVRTAARSDVSEEVTRFRAHLAHWAALAEGDEPCGRKLDFLLQEMNREVNTIGAKADGLGVSQLVIDAKTELERMKEQVQNVE
jgi:uncharacterized protein (TIGR00255 family)